LFHEQIRTKPKTIPIRLSGTLCFLGNIKCLHSHKLKLRYPTCLTSPHQYCTVQAYRAADLAVNSAPLNQHGWEVFKMFGKETRECEPIWWRMSFDMIESSRTAHKLNGGRDCLVTFSLCSQHAFGWRESACLSYICEKVWVVLLVHLCTCMWICTYVCGVAYTSGGASLRAQSRSAFSIPDVFHLSLVPIKSKHAKLTWTVYALQCNAICRTAVLHHLGVWLPSMCTLSPSVRVPLTCRIFTICTAQE